MNLSFLKKIRIVVSLLFFLAIGLLFIDIRHILPPYLAEPPLYLQFIPSILTFLTVSGMAIAGFMFILLLNLLFGRVYCSSICPFGTLQDIIIYIHRKYKKRRWFKFSKPQNILRYSLLIIAILTFLFGTITVVNLLDPYSNFGRIFSNILRPGLILLNNIGASILHFFDNHFLFYIDFPPYGIATIALPVIVLGALIWMTIARGRLWCNTICPVGSLLGWLSKFSLFRITIDTSKCTECGKCERVCKAECIDQENQHLDFTRCVSCFNCLEVCPENTFYYKFAFSKTREAKSEFVQIDVNKRNMLFASATAATGYLATACSSAGQGGFAHVPAIRKHPASPPGSLSIENYTDACTSCNLCVAACPTQVLQPSVLEYNSYSFLQPKMDYIAGFCNYDCTICSEVCPTAAIQPIDIETKKRVQLGEAIFLLENCVVYTKRTECGSCAEHCPTKACRMVQWDQDNLRIPVVEEEICIGCGACEYACPTTPNKAIYVQPHSEHKVADLPKQEKLEEKETEEEFPF